MMDRQLAQFLPIKECFLNINTSFFVNIWLECVFCIILQPIKWVNCILTIVIWLVRYIMKSECVLRQMCKMQIINAILRQVEFLDQRGMDT